MRNLSPYRASGSLLMYAGLIWAIGTVVMPRGSSATLADISARVGATWIVAAALMILGAVLGLAAMIGVYRILADGARPAWALLFLATGAIGMTVTVLVAALNGVSEPLLVRAARTAPQPGALDAAQAALGAATAGLYLTHKVIAWLVLVPLGVAMLPDRAWPRAIAWATMVCGVVEAVGPFLLIGRPALLELLTLAGFAYLVVLGAAIARMGRTPAPEVVQPDAGVQV